MNKTIAIVPLNRSATQMCIKYLYIFFIYHNNNINVLNYTWRLIKKCALYGIKLNRNAVKSESSRATLYKKSSRAVMINGVEHVFDWRTIHNGQTFMSTLDRHNASIVAGIFSFYRHGAGSDKTRKWTGFSTRAANTGPETKIKIRRYFRSPRGYSTPPITLSDRSVGTRDQTRTPSHDPTRQRP